MLCTLSAGLLGAILDDIQSTTPGVDSINQDLYLPGPYFTGWKIYFTASCSSDDAFFGSPTH